MGTPPTTTPPATTPPATLPASVSTGQYTYYQDVARQNAANAYASEAGYETHQGFRTDDPIGNYLFSINLSGWATGWFTNVGGIGVEFDVIEHKLTSVTGEPYIIQIPGRPKWNRLTLKHGVLSTNEDLWTWLAYVQRGQMLRARAHCTLYLYNKAGKVAAAWDIVNAWPSKIAGPDLDAAGQAVAIESLELVHNGMWRTQ
jgi:phage tail-like protein